MTSTFTEYQLISKNISKALDRKSKEYDVKKEVQYFKDNIGKVKTVDEFLRNTRLYTFAMKAFGLDDMIYAKGFMKNVLVGEPDSNGRVLVDRLQDSRYRDFAAAFNFKAYGQKPTSSDPELQAMIDAFTKKNDPSAKPKYDSKTEDLKNYITNISPFIKSMDDIVSDSTLSDIIRTTLGLPPAASTDGADENAALFDGKIDVSTFQDPEQLREFIDRFADARWEGRKALVDPYVRTTGEYADSDSETGRLVQYFRNKMKNVYSAADIAEDPALFGVVQTALGLPASASSQDQAAQTKLIDSKINILSLRDPKALDRFLDRFKNAHDDARNVPVDSYIRQSLETDEGNENEGVRLALYFRRMAGTVKSAYSILADKALAEVVRTALGLPPEAARANIEAQAALINRKLDISSLKDPAQVEKLLQRFTTMWDAKNGGGAASSALSFLGGADSSLDTDLLVRLQSIRLGGR
ncbi:DUF1217 domain-containing protein [Methylobacterium brachiatum]|uniref:DUF1217 domain-containing protein n=1 Tax=Methylobacterium brachiatum TaxID=269660 RepID=A0AAJ1TV58_9HYPH|nr:DUF1217 domain-containing protein [Methylobacterium brachiatum]MCB4804350.1 DUF1217 domain-containing protein [Methylobacterium brachiatum]MDQ0545379.1 hypothetical protein [Methylobacterium brachiatum]